MDGWDPWIFEIHGVLDRWSVVTKEACWCVGTNCCSNARLDG